MKNLKMVIPILAVVALGLCAGSFYGGMAYARSKALPARPFGQGSGTGSFDPQLTGGRMGVRNGGVRAGTGFLNGEIISSDEKSVTVKLRDGGSRIVLLSENTEISKFTAGETGDLQSGLNVMVSGSDNSDGSLTAQTIQIRPEGTEFGPIGSGAQR